MRASIALLGKHAQFPSSVPRGGLVSSARYLSTMMPSIGHVSRSPILPSPVLELEPSKATVVILGGRSQLGETTRRRFLAAGWNVICTTQGKATSKFDERDFHLVGGVNFLAKEARTWEYWRGLFQDIAAKHGPIHTVVNCAGIAINDVRSGVLMEDVNTKPVQPMLEATYDLGIRRYTFISSEAAAVEAVRVPGSYSASKYLAEEAIKETVAARGNTSTKVSILRPDYIISPDNPGHFGSPQTSSTMCIKVTAGRSAKKAGETILWPVAAYDVADAIINISEHDVDTPDIIDACGPRPITISALLDMFRAWQGKRFVVGIKIPTEALLPFATILPKGAFEPDHLRLIDHYEEHNVTATGDNRAFSRLVGLSRPGNTDSPLLTLEEVFSFIKRPVFGDPDIGKYCKEFAQNINPHDIPMICNALVKGVMESRIDLNPHREEKTADDGTPVGHVFLFMLGALLAISASRSKKKEEDEDSTKTVGPHTARLTQIFHENTELSRRGCRF